MRLSIRSADLVDRYLIHARWARSSGTSSTRTSPRCSSASHPIAGWLRLQREREEIEPWWASLYVRDLYLLGAALAYVMVDASEALRLLEEKLRVSSELRTRFGVADTEFFIGLTRLGLGEPVAAAESCRRALIGHHDVGVQRGILMSLSGAAGIAVQTRRTADAAPILAGLRRARAELNSPGTQNEQFAEERIARRIARELGTDALDQIDAAGLETTIDLALAMLDAVAHDPALKP